MNNYIRRFTQLMVGLILFSIGIVMTIQANIGYAPWDVFHAGFAKQIGITLGLASIILGIIIGIITVLLGEKIGIGTLSNMILIGIFLDLIMFLNIIPRAEGFINGLVMLITGMFVIALGSYFYIGSGFGAGPRDSLMVGITRKTSLPIGICRVVIELLTALIGYFMGGLVGFGTIISAFAIGFCVQVTFNFLKFDTTKVKHETISNTLKGLRAL